MPMMSSPRRSTSSTHRLTMSGTCGSAGEGVSTPVAAATAAASRSRTVSRSTPNSLLGATTADAAPPRRPLRLPLGVPAAAAAIDALLLLARSKVSCRFWYPRVR